MSTSPSVASKIPDRRITSMGGTLREDFSRTGCLPPRPLVDDAAITHLRALAIDSPQVRLANAAKELWRVDSQTLEIATSAAISSILDVLFGDDGYYLWGAQLLERRPRDAHTWHVDVETARPGFVTVWIGIDGTCPETSLSLIEGSHTLSGPVQAFWPPDDPARIDPKARKILLHPELAGTAAPTLAACRDGEGIFFDGLLWHGSFNRASHKRRALLLQYGKHGTPVRRTPSFDAYPFQYHPTDNPVTIPIRGEPDPVANKTVVRRADGALVYPAAKTCARPALSQSADRSWQIHPYFRIESPVMAGFSCHASVLGPGYMPHTPHEHGEEEVLVVLSGEAAIFAGASRSGALRVDRAVAGDIFYYPPGFQHTIANLAPDNEPLRYVMFKWTGRAGRAQKVDGYKIPASAHAQGKRLMVDRPASGLDKLHIHSTTLAPGEGFERHTDRYDTAIIVLEGELSMLDATLGPGGVFYSRAGELHDTRNTSDAPCHYLVFEFHAMAG
jgi:uncharacterized RmlC-like cupin family protein